MIRIGPQIGTYVGLGVGINGLGGSSDTTLSVTIADSVDPVISVVNFTYAVVVTNTGSNTATDVEAVVALDASLTFVSGVGTGWTVDEDAGVVTCTRATLAVGAAPTVTITVTSANAASTETTTADAVAGNAPAATQDSETTVVKLVDRDATSGIRFPSNATQWTDFNAYHVALGTANFPNVTPSSVWLMQEASGNLADSVGAVTLTLAGTGHLFQQAVAGWDRDGVQGVDGTAGQKWSNSTGAANPNTSDTFVMAYLDIPAAAPAVARCVMGKAAAMDLRFNTTGKLRVVLGASADLTVDNRGTTIVAALKVDNTNTVSACYTTAEKLIGTYAQPASSPFVFLYGQTAAASAIKCLCACEFSGAGGRMTDAQVKSLYQALGWVIPWT